MKKIKALQNYTDSLLKKDIVKGDEYIVDNERAEAIVKVIFKDKPLAEIIEDIKEEAKVNITSKIEQKVDDVILTTFADGEEIEKISIKETNKETKPKTTTKKKVAKKK